MKTVTEEILKVTCDACGRIMFYQMGKLPWIVTCPEIGCGKRIHAQDKDAHLVISILIETKFLSS